MRARRHATTTRFGLLLAGLLLAGCGGAPRAVPARVARARAALDDVRRFPGQPPIALVIREGDPASAIGAAVTLDGLESTSSRPLPEMSAALAGMVERRLAEGSAPGRVVPSWDGFRVSALVTAPSAMDAALKHLVDALRRPAAAADLEAARRKLTALRARPLEDLAVAPFARCVGGAFGTPARAGLPADDLSLEELERARDAAHTRARVALSVVGDARAANAAASALERGERWREDTSAFRRSVVDRPNAANVTASSFVGAGGPSVRVRVALTLEHSSDAPAVAAALGDPASPLVERLLGLGVPFRLREAVGTVHPTSGCVGVVLDATGEATAAASAIADAVALVHAETRALLGDDAEVTSQATSFARRAGDAREAAERAARWALTAGADAAHASQGAPLKVHVVVAHGGRGRSSPRELAEQPLPDVGPAIEAALARGVRKNVEARSRVERGQGETYVLFGSPCGVRGEGKQDAGITALFVLAASASTTPEDDVVVEPWITAGGVGLFVHGPPRRGETPRAHARRLADVAGRAFAAQPLDARAVGRARVEQRRRASASFARLASALSPRLPSAIAPFGNADASGRLSDAAVALRAESVRSGPLRVAVIANDDTSQVEAAVAAVDRWITPRPEGARACPALDEGGAEKTRAGTYAVASGIGPPEAWLAFPFDATPPRMTRTAGALAAALAGQTGLLRRALATSPPLAAEAEARVVGSHRGSALAIRVAADEGTLDAAVSQVRALVDRLRQGGLTAEDLARGSDEAARARLERSLDPRARAVTLFEDPRPETAPPTLEELRAFAGASLAEDAMVIVAKRAARNTSP